MVVHGELPVLRNFKVLSSHGLQASASADAPDHTLPLAPIDVALADYTIWSALVYRERLDSSLLEHAARVALGKFPQLAGQLRLRKDGYDILCNNQGASFSTASCTNHLQEFLPPQGNTHFKPVLVHAALKHVPQTAADYIGTSASLLHMVHLQLEGNASCLIITMPHKVAELNSMRLFTQHWAWHYRQLQAQHQYTTHATSTSRSISSAHSSSLSAPAAPVYMRSLFDQVAAQGVSLHQASKQPSSSPVPLTSRVWKRAAPAAGPAAPSESDTEASQASEEDPASSQAAEQASGDQDAAEAEYNEVFVHISQQQLQQLKQQAMHDVADMASSSAAQQQVLASGQGTVTWVSSCDAMWGHVRKLLGKLSARAGKAFDLVFAMDMRERVDCIPPGAFGNWILALPTARVEPSSHTLGALASELRQEILASADTFCTECAYLQQQEQEGALLLQWRDISSMVTPSGCVILSNWDWREADAQFGEGVVPVWVQGGGGTGGIFPNLLLAFRELGPGGGYWLQVCLHREPLQELRAVLEEA